MESVFDAAGGLDGLVGLASAWHHRVMADDVVAHAFSHGYRSDHTQRLASYWAEALGGPPLYTSMHGNETDVVRIHSGNGPHDEMNERAIRCFDEALADVGWSIDEPLGHVLHDYFAWATLGAMNRFHDDVGDVPAGIVLPRWSWDGLVEAHGSTS